LAENALFVEVRVSIRAAAPTDAELHEEAAVFLTAAGQKEHSVWCRMIVNFSQNITSKSLKISHPIFGFHQRSSTNHAFGPKLEPTTELASFRWLY
jgi:hypothetical protein